jgi:hypothetical protein
MCVDALSVGGGGEAEDEQQCLYTVVELDGGDQPIALLRRVPNGGTSCVMPAVELGFARPVNQACDFGTGELVGVRAAGRKHGPGLPEARSSSSEGSSDVRRDVDVSYVWFGSGVFVDALPSGWHHITVVCDATLGISRFYVDGTLHCDRESERPAPCWRTRTPRRYVLGW